MNNFASLADASFGFFILTVPFYCNIALGHIGHEFVLFTVTAGLHTR